MRLCGGHLGFGTQEHICQYPDVKSGSTANKLSKEELCDPLFCNSEILRILCFLVAAILNFRLKMKFYKSVGSTNGISIQNMYKWRHYTALYRDN